MNFKDGFTAAHIRPVESDTAVKATGAEQSRVEDVGTVCGSHHDHVGVGIETIHLDKHLVESLLTLIVGPAQTSAALASNGINFVNKNYTGGMALGLVKQVSHAAGTHTDEHFHELRAGDGE